MGNFRTDTDIEEVLRNLRQEFVDNSQDMLAEIERLIGRMSRNDSGDEAFMELRRHVHTIKGQGGTFGFRAHPQGRQIHLTDKLRCR